MLCRWFFVLLLASVAFALNDTSTQITNAGSESTNSETSPIATTNSTQGTTIHVDITTSEHSTDHSSEPTQHSSTSGNPTTTEQQTTEHQTTERQTTERQTTEHQTTGHNTTAAPEHSTTAGPTTIEPTTPSVPTPRPGTSPSQGKWSVNDPTTNKTCLQLQMAAQFAIEYKHHPDNKTVTTYINLPSDLNVTGHCDNKTEAMTFVWGNNSYNLELVFENKYKVTDDSRTHYALSMSTFTYLINEADFPGFEADLMNTTLTSMWQKPNETDANAPLDGPDGRLYKCDAERTLELIGVVNATMKVKDVQLQAFMTDGKSGDVAECDADDKTDDIVPIAVGCALAGLVIIVLIAYLVGRRRSRQKGYQSV